MNNHILLFSIIISFNFLSFCGQPLLNPAVAPNQDELFHTAFNLAANKIWQERNTYYKKASKHLGVRGLCCLTLEEEVLTVNIKDSLILQDLKMQYKLIFIKAYGAEHPRLQNFAAFDKEAHERSQQFVDDKTKCCCSVQ